MSDWKDDYNLLGLGGLTSLITNVKVSAWGNEVAIECVYNPEERLPYVLSFKDCREIGWTVHDEEEVGEIEAEFFGISLGEPEHRKPAVITTDIFEISILYGSFSIHKEEQVNFEKADLATEVLVSQPQAVL
ncbi:MAG: hypothetical protein MUE44_11915 [Oscillatoriaceae cyanobacterium Prado104]|jgi:hypothetical protein|nr:hypothetical protein [Oscillatoriaceae cyanobacterium Prado104]